MVAVIIYLVDCFCVHHRIGSGQSLWRARFKAEEKGETEQEKNSVNGFLLVRQNEMESHLDKQGVYRIKDVDSFIRPKPSSCYCAWSPREKFCARCLQLCVHLEPNYGGETWHTSSGGGGGGGWRRKSSGTMKLSHMPQPSMGPQVTKHDLLGVF
jgi:hypothetical protein